MHCRMVAIFGHTLNVRIDAYKSIQTAKNETWSMKSIACFFQLHTISSIELFWQLRKHNVFPNTLHI